MPSLNDALGVDLSGYTKAQPVGQQATAAPPTSTESTVNPFLRSPIPPVWSSSPDSLRQFTNNGMVPQTRILSPSLNLQSSGTGTVNNYLSDAATATSGGSSSGGSSSGGSTSTNTATQVALVTGILNPNQIYKTTLKTALAFQLLSLSATKECRIQLYGTSLAQSADASRLIDTAPPAGSAQGIICDLVLDTSPYTWQFQNRSGANADNPQQGLIYVSLTNLSAASTAITVTVSYVALES